MSILPHLRTTVYPATSIDLHTGPDHVYVDSLVGDLGEETIRQLALSSYHMGHSGAPCEDIERLIDLVGLLALEEGPR